MSPAAVERRLALAWARLAAALDGDARAHPGFAAAVIVARGRLVLDPGAFAALLRVPEAAVRAWESGGCDPGRAPRRLRLLAPELDWDGAGVTAPGHPGDPASRHPSAASGLGRAGTAPAGRESPPSRASPGEHP